MESATISEKLLADITAEEYRNKGYEVSREAQLDFLPGFRTDLVVRKGDEVKVIEVKSRASLAANREIRELARVIHSKPGWSFELLMVGEPEKLDSPEGAQSFEDENILRRIEEAEKALESGLSEAAFLLAWSACEAAIRELLTLQGIANSDITKPGYVLDQSLFHGIIPSEEYQHLTDMQKYRNAIVHGFSVSDFSDDLVTELIDTVRRLINMTTRRTDMA